MGSRQFYPTMTVSRKSYCLLLSLISRTFSLDCPTNYQDISQVGLGCIFPMQITGYSWEQADEACWAESEEHLVEILPTVAEGVEMWWIGATDLYSEGFWYWVYSQEMCSYTLWSEGQPSNTGGMEHCAALVTKDGYKWNDYICTETIQRIAYLICEIT